MKTITFTDKELDSLILLVDYLKDSEQKHYEEYSADAEKCGEHIYEHTIRVENAVTEGVAAAADSSA